MSLISQPTLVSELDTPALLINRPRMSANLERMQRLANSRSVALRPHIKTHKSPSLARLQIATGASGIAVAKLSEAEIMADAGIDDIQIANQIVGEQKIARLINLSRRCRLTCAVDSTEQVSAIAGKANSESITVRLLIELDSGLHRCGLSETQEVVRLARFINDTTGVELAGVMTHAGHAYAAETVDDIKQIGTHEGLTVVKAAEAIRQTGMRCKVVSVGSTPTAEYASAVKGVTELRVGNYIFYDMMQVAIGSTKLEDCSLSVLATVISRPSPDRAVLDVGSKGLTPERGAHSSVRLQRYGYLPDNDLWIERLSEEHAVVVGNGIDLKIGNKVQVIPNHACTVANQFKEAWLVEEGRIIERIEITARGQMT